MLRRILVPTDGSELSARAFPLAEQIARAQAAEILLVRIVEFPSWTWMGNDSSYASGPEYMDMVELIKSDARDALDRAAEDLKASALTVRTSLLEGYPSSMLLDCERDLEADLVVMGSHGRTGLLRFTLGSVADRLIRGGVAPVLMVRSDARVPDSLTRALVPLDGSALAEEALSTTEILAGKPLREVNLLRAIASPNERTRALQYLEGPATKLSSLGLTVRCEVAVEDPSEAIHQAGEAVDLVIMTTHGRGGFDRLRHGSVALGATHELKTPVLLVRAGSGDGQPQHD